MMIIMSYNVVGFKIRLLFEVIWWNVMFIRRKNLFIWGFFFLEYDVYKNGDCLSEYIGMLIVCKNIFYKIDIFF